jgi:hypothetical protein
MLKSWETVALYIEKHHPDKTVTIRAINLFSDNAVLPFHQILKHSQKQLSLDNFLIYFGNCCGEIITAPDCPDVGISENLFLGLVSFSINLFCSLYYSFHSRMEVVGSRKWSLFIHIKPALHVGTYSNRQWQQH